MKRFLLFALLLACVSWKPEARRWMVVLHAQAGSISNSELVLTNPNQLVAAFTADDGREAQTLSLDQLLQKWNVLFQNTPPNAAIASISQGGQLKESIVILDPPKQIGNTLTFEIVELSEPFDGSLGETIVYIDNAISSQIGTQSKFPAATN